MRGNSIKQTIPGMLSTIKTGLMMYTGKLSRNVEFDRLSTFLRVNCIYLAVEPCWFDGEMIEMTA